MESTSAPGQYKSAYKKYNKWSNWNKNKDSNNQSKEGTENSAESNQKPSNNYSNNNASNLPESSFDLGKNKRVTVRQFRNVNLIDIREYYKDSNGDLKPGKKGISLTEDMFDSFLSNYKNIDEALRRLGSNRNNSVDFNAFENLKNNNDSKLSQNSAAGTLLIDNSGTVKSEEDASIGTKRSNEDQIEKENNKKLKENGLLTPAPPQQEQHKKVEAQENNANLVIPTKQVKKDIDSDDDFANDLENALTN